jgi:hypothetical protein
VKVTLTFITPSVKGLENKELNYTASIVSLHDVPDFSAMFDFTNKSARQRIPASDIIISGQSNWTGDLKANQVTQFSANIKLPEPGEWEIYVEGNSRHKEEINRSGYAESIKITT